MKTLTVSQRIEFQAENADDYEWLKGAVASSYSPLYTVTTDDANLKVVIEKVSQETAP